MVKKGGLRDKMRIGLRKRTLTSIRSTALDGIREIKARLHSIRLSAGRKYREEYDLKYLKKALNNPWHDKHFKPEDRGGIYKMKYIKQLNNFQINLFIGRMGHQPYFQIEVHHKTDNNPNDLKRLLISIDKLIPEIRVSQVEYTIDQCCYEPIDVENLAWVERLSLYCPDARGEVKQIFGGEIIDDNSRNSLMWHLGDKDKIYERGDDDKKKKRTWAYYDFNRVRLEHTADRRELVCNKILTLKNLINGPKFHEIYHNNWDFRRFKECNSKNRIMEWEEEVLPFQLLIRKTKLENPTQYSERVEELASLIARLLEAMKVFDDEWENETKD
jgi:hypothetical protein